MDQAVCPECGDRVRLPLDASAEATVRCPLCSQEFPLRRILENAPPLLELVHDPAAPQADSPAPAAPFVFQEQDPPRKKKSAFRPRTSSNSGGRRRRSSNGSAAGGIWAVAKVIGGGVAGVVIAQGFLWWAPLDLNVNQRDPAGIGAALPEAVAWLAPASVRGFPTEDERAQESGEQDSSDNDPLAGLSGKEAKDGTAKSGASQRSDSDSDDADLGKGLWSLPPPKKNGLGAGGALGGGGPDPSAAPAKVESPQQLEPPSGPEWLTRRIPAVGFPALAGAVKRAERDLGLWIHRDDGLDARTRQTMFTDCYAALAEVGRLAALSDREGRIRRKADEANQLLSQFADDRDTPGLTPGFAEAWLGGRVPDADTGGLLLYGKIIEVQTGPNWAAAKLVPPGRTREFWVLHPNRLPEREWLNQTVLVAGAWFANPAELKQPPVVAGNGALVVGTWRLDAPTTEVP